MKAEKGNDNEDERRVGEDLIERDRRMDRRGRNEVINIRFTEGRAGERRGTNEATE